MEYTSAHSVKRTWVNYGMARDWMDSMQGQVCLCVCVCVCACRYYDFLDSNRGRNFYTIRLK